MKKVLSFILSAMMMLSLGTTAMAEKKEFTSDDVIVSLGEMLNYGVFTKEYAGQPHTEATIAAEKATQLGEYGFSGNNFNLIKNKLTVNYDAGDKNLTLVLFRNGIEYFRKDVTGTGSHTLEKVPGGEYEVKLMENGEYILTEGNTKELFSESYGNVSYFGKLEGTSVGMPVGPGLVLLNNKEDYEKNKNYNARQGVEIVYTEDSIDFTTNLDAAADLSAELADAVTGGSFKVYNLKSNEINSNDVVNNGFKADGYDYILINLDVTGKNDVTIQGNYKRDGRSMDANFSNNWRDQAKVIYNPYVVKNGEKVPYTGTLREQNPLTGILLAPYATVYGAGNHGGIIIAGKYFHHKGEVHQMRPDAEAFEGELSVKEKEPETEVPEIPEVPEVPEVPETPEVPEIPDEDTSINLKGANYAYIFGYEPVIIDFINENGEVESKAEVEMAMDDAVTVEQVSSMLMRMLDQHGDTMDQNYPVVGPVVPYEGQWYERGLAYLYSVGGFEGDEIRIAPITRGQVAKLVACALKLNLSEETPFTDIEGHKYQEYIEKVYKYRYMLGMGDEHFAPDAIMTRAEFCSLFNSITDKDECGLVALDEEGNEYTITAEDYYFIDMDPSHWAYEICLKATSAYDENGYVDVVTRNANIRNILDHHEAQLKY